MTSTTDQHEQQRSERGRLVRIATDSAVLQGNLTLPEGAAGIALFVHGSGSSRHSPRNVHVARSLNQAQLGTLLVDLLTPEEERIDLVSGQLRFDIDLLASRLVDVTDWITEQPETRRLQVGYFGASTGAAAAIDAAAERSDVVRAIVSRGGRPDLAGAELKTLRAPMLLIVGGKDPQVVELNRFAFEMLRCEKDLVVIPEASHLFEEPGALDKVARLARQWFERYLTERQAHAGYRAH